MSPTTVSSTDAPFPPLLSASTMDYDSYNGDAASHNGTANGGAASPLPPQTSASSIIRKKLMGYVGFANLPNQVHRKSVRKGFQFTAMVVGMNTYLVQSVERTLILN